MKYFYLLLLICCIGCQFNEYELQELKTFELTIHQANASDTSLDLSWTKAEHSDFEHYTILRSQEAIPALDEPSSYFIVAQFDDVNTTNFTDIVTQMSPNYHYKVFAKVGTRYLQSESQHIHFDNLTKPSLQRTVYNQQAVYKWNSFHANSFNSYFIIFSENPVNSGSIHTNAVQTVHIPNRSQTSFTHSQHDTLPAFHYYTLGIDIGDRIVLSDSYN